MNNKIIILLRKYYIGAFSVAIFFVVWEITARLKLINSVFISSPSKVYSAGYEMLGSGEIFPHIFISLEALFSGLFLAAALGMIIGLMIGSNKTLYQFFSPHIYALNSLPTVAVIPLIIIWFGIGIYAKIAIVFMMALKPILINVIDGVRNVDKKLIGMSRSFGADSIFVLRSITLFSILPFLFSGLRISIGRSITGLIVGEAFGYGKGLGFLVSFYGSTLQTSRLMFIILLLLFISAGLINIILYIEKKIIIWRAD